MSKIIKFPGIMKSSPSSGVAVEETNTSLATFKDFFFQNMLGDLAAASKTLEALFEVDSYTAKQYTTKYNSKFLSDPTITMKTLGIKEAIDNGSKNDALVLIQYCFDCSIVEAIGILAALLKH